MPKSLVNLGKATKVALSGPVSLRACAGNPPSGAPISLGNGFDVNITGIDEPLPLGSHYRVGQHYTFSARYSGNGTFAGRITQHEDYYDWTPQNGTVISQDGDEAVIRFASHGNTAVNLDYDDGFNLPQNAFISVSVRQSLPSVEIISVTGDGVEGHRAQVSVNFANADHWEIRWGDGGKTMGSANGVQSVSYTYATEGDFDIVAEAWNVHDESDTDTYADFTSVADPPVLSNISVTTPGNSVRVQFDYEDHFPVTSITIHWDRNNQGPQHVWHWQDANGLNSGSIDQTHSYNTSSHPYGSYRIYIVVINSAGKTATYGVTKSGLGVIGNNAPVVTITNTRVVAGNVAEITFTATDQDGDIESWQIDWGDGSFTNGNPSMESSINITRQHDYSPNSAFGQQVGVVVVDSKSNFDSDTEFIF